MNTKPKRTRKMKTEPDVDSSMNNDQNIIIYASTEASTEASSGTAGLSQAYKKRKVRKTKNIYRHHQLHLCESNLNVSSEPFSNITNILEKREFIMNAAKMVFIQHVAGFCREKYPRATKSQKKVFLESYWDEMDMLEKQDFVAEVMGPPDETRKICVTPILKHFDKFPEKIPVVESDDDEIIFFK